MILVNSSDLLLFFILSFFLLLVYLDIFVVPIHFKNLEYAFKVFLDISLYIAELIFFFLFFLWVTSSDLFSTYNESSLLKNFIDFFTLYQIGILVLLKMLNFRIIQEYFRCLTVLQSIRNMLEINKTVFSTLKELKNRQEAVLPLKAKEYYRDIYFVVLNYEYLKMAERFSLNFEFIDAEYTKNKITELNNNFIVNLNAIEISITSLLTDKQNEWEVSIFLKIIKIWENALQKKDFKDEEYYVERESKISFLEDEIKRIQLLINE